jgi:hypothetical protein
MKWVTWQQVGIDRMGCAWLIRRFIDAHAEFQFVPSGQSLLPEDATAFDIPGVRLSHHGGRCTFSTMLQVYDLADPVLQRIARMIDEADTVQEVTLEPAAPGLDLLCRGLRRISSDDEVALVRGALLYDALYAELASAGAPTVTTDARTPGERTRSVDPPPRFAPHHERDGETLEDEALARWEGEGGTAPLSESTGPVASG